MRFDIETQASPEQVHRALTDFTQQRLHSWNRTLDPKIDRRSSRVVEGSPATAFDLG